MAEARGTVPVVTDSTSLTVGVWPLPCFTAGGLAGVGTTPRLMIETQGPAGADEVLPKRGEPEGFVNPIEPGPLIWNW